MLLDTATNTAIGDVAIPGTSTVVAVTFPATGSRTYLATDGGIAEIDTSRNAVLLGVTPLGGPVTSLTATPDGTRGYAAVGSVVIALDTASGDRLATIPQPGTQSPGMSATLDGGRVYVANGAAGTVTVIDTGTNAVVGTVRVGDAAFDVAIRRTTRR